MFIAEQKKRENIAEYLLYMWQLEDILRAFELDIDKVQKGLIDTTNHSDQKKEEARQWYMNLIEQMKLEGVEKTGHLNVNRELLNDLTLVHTELLKNGKEIKYIEAYYKTMLHIQELRSKTTDHDASDIEICFTALYGYLLLKLQKREISSETASAIAQISQLIGSLSEKYKLLSNKQN
ncbi:MAG: DUF4924 family protein [Bacteroidales bacterium]|nr:DUF4924 family protein [Bacteroidales bacterium]